MGTLYRLDRFEDCLAVLEREDGLSITPKRWLTTTQEGDVLKVETAVALDELEPGDTAPYIERDEAATGERLERARRLREGLTKGPEI